MVAFFEGADGDVAVLPKPLSLNPAGTIESTWASCCGALRYGGTDDGTLIRLADLGLAEQCNFRPKQEPKTRARTCVSFEFAAQPQTVAASAKEITTYLADFSGSLMAGMAECLPEFHGSKRIVRLRVGLLLAEPCREKVRHRTTV